MRPDDAGAVEESVGRAAAQRREQLGEERSQRRE